MRRRPGLAGIDQARSLQTQYKALGEQNQREQRAHLEQKLGEFRSALEEFALKHRAEISKNPVFRAQFHEMCANVGVDPLASNKGFWTQMLGFGDFYFELAVQIVEAAMAARAHNGGLMELRLLRAAVLRRRGAAADPVSEDDVLRAIESLKCLGGGWAVLTAGGRRIVRSVPAELNSDQNAILEAASAAGGCVSVEGMVRGKGWAEVRVKEALDSLLRDGFVMVDDGARDRARLFWVMAVASAPIDAAVGSAALS
jgi:ESCRT-II complex subunit VPS22